MSLEEKKMQIKPRYKHCHRTNGFNLIELISTIAIIGIIAIFALPNFSGIIKNSRLTSKVDDIVVALNTARQVAVSRGLTTFVCHSNNADTTTPTCGGGTGSDWNTGYIVYTAALRTIVSAQRDYVSSTDALIKQSKLEDGDGITVVDTNAASYISFGADALLFGDNAIELKICDNRTGENGYLIKVSVAGRISRTAATGVDACT